MNEIIRILMKRDNLSFAEAKEIYDECKVRIDEALITNDSIEDIMMEDLGLELDYIFDII
jgi:hypothetical protein